MPILLTGSGAFSNAFSKHASCKVLSLRNTDDDTFGAALKKAKVVIHNAASINCKNVDEAIRDNFQPTVRLVELCLLHNPKIRFILLGSMSYLASEKEYLPLEEMSPYAYSKYLAESFCLKCSLPEVYSVRFSTLFYGDPERDGLSKLIFEAAVKKNITIFNGGHARRDFIPLEVAAAYVAKLARQGASTKAMTIASAASTSFGKIARFLRKRIPSLVITDQPAPPGGKDVLSKFSDRHIQELGEINFALEEEMEKYLVQLKHEINRL